MSLIKRNWISKLLFSDPALIRLISATVTVFTMGVAFVAEWKFVQVSGTLTGSSALVVNPQAHHEAVVTAMLVGGLMALMLGLTYDETEIRGAIAAVMIQPIPLLFSALLALAIGSRRWEAIALLPLLLGAGTLMKRFGQRFNNFGLLLYMGGFFGYFLSAQFGIAALYWLVPEVLIASAINLLIRLLLLKIEAGSNLERAARSYHLHATRLARRTIRVLSRNEPMGVTRLREQLNALNEMALIVEGYMSRSRVGSSLRQTLFDVELSLSNLVRFVETLSEMNLPILVTRDMADRIETIPQPDTAAFDLDLADAARRWATFLPQNDTVGRIMIGRLASSIRSLNAAEADWKSKLDNLTKVDFETDAALLTYVTPVRIGQLPGSSLVSAQASAEPWESPSGFSLGLTPELRTAVQITIATALAAWAGYLVDPTRFYWAPLSALLCFVGVNNAGEQVWKGVYRILGTILGVIMGSVLARALGTNPLLDALAILATMFFAIYLFRINYTFMAMGITISISMVFLQLSELSADLLIARVVETAIGALIAALTAIFILPLGPRRVIKTAKQRLLRALGLLIIAAIKSIEDPQIEVDILGLARRTDSDFQALLATLRPLQWSLLGNLNREATELISKTTAVRNYSRSLLADLLLEGRIDPAIAHDLQQIALHFEESISNLTRSGGDRTYRRVTLDVELIKSRHGIEPTPAKMMKIDLILRDLALLDESLSELAQTFGVKVVNPLQSLVSEKTSEKPD